MDIIVIDDGIAPLSFLAYHHPHVCHMLPSLYVAYILGNTFALSLYFNSFSFMFEYVNISKDLTKKKDKNFIHFTVFFVSLYITQFTVFLKIKEPKPQIRKQG